MGIFRGGLAVGARRSEAPARQLRTLGRAGVSIVTAERTPGLHQSDLVLDGIIGYGLSGPPRGAAAHLIRWTNAQPAPVLALDVPSGVDPTTGAVYDPAICAVATLTLALPKTGLRAPEASAHVGELYVADIGIPPEVYASLGVATNHLFATGEIQRLGGA